MPDGAGPTPKQERDERRFRCDRPAAMRPEAFWWLFDSPDRKATTPDENGTIVVTVRGALEQHKCWFWDSYEEIKQRVSDAVALKPETIVLSINSPGGVVAGCFETVGEISAMAERADIQLVAYVDGLACSAGFALACAASKIYAPTSALLGSIGVVEGFLDVSKMDEERGVQHAFVTSGERKVDGNPHVPLSESALAAAQKRVDGLASEFFGLVSTARGITTEKVAGLEAAIVQAPEGQSLGLIDGVMTLDELLAAAGRGELKSTKEPKMAARKTTKKTPSAAKKGKPAAAEPTATAEFDDAVAALRDIADGGEDPAEVEKAKRMLEAMDSEGESEPMTEEDAEAAAQIVKLTLEVEELRQESKSAREEKRVDEAIHADHIEKSDREFALKMLRNDESLYEDWVTKQKARGPRVPKGRAYVRARASSSMGSAWDNLGPRETAVARGLHAAKFSKAEAAEYAPEMLRRMEAGEDRAAVIRELKSRAADARQEIVA